MQNMQPAKSEGTVPRTVLRFNTSNKFGGSHNHPQVENSLEGFSELTEDIIPVMGYYRTGCSFSHRAKSGRVSHTKLPLSPGCFPALESVCSRTHRELSSRESHALKNRLS